MQDKNGAFDLAGGFPDVHIPANLKQSSRGLCGRCRALLVAPGTRMLDRPAWLERIRPYLQQGMVVLRPADAREIGQHPCLFDFLRPIMPPHPSKRVGAEEYKFANPLRMPRCILDGDRTTLARSQNRKLLEPGRIDDGFEVADPSFE